MAAYDTRKHGTEARSQTIANRTARAVKTGAIRTTHAGHVRHNPTR